MLKEILLLSSWLVFWGLITYVVLNFVLTQKLKKSQDKSEKIISDAKEEKSKLLEDAKERKQEIISEADSKKQEMLNDVRKLESRVLDKEEKLEKKFDELSLKQEKLFSKEEELDKEKNKVEEKSKDLDSKLSEMSKLSEKEAKDLFLKEIETKYEKDAFKLLEKRKKDFSRREKEESREIILKAIQRYAWDVANEVTTTVIQLEDDDIKGRLIWKEWRNIISFERETWVSLIIDDTPGSVFISSFDLFRRYIAKVSLEKLIEDKRIQPARIEEIVAQTREEAEDLLLELWQKAVDDLWITDFPEEIIRLVWKLRFRTSYWQNILKHSTEVAYIAEAIAKDLWVNSDIVKKWALLHDLWKALDHDLEWTHPEIGARVGRKYWLDEKIVDMIENHHWEPTIISIEASIVQIADAISSIRPWARRESIELYLKRVKELETIASSMPWVEKAYAVSAWREVRVFVNAETISDVDALKTAKKIADKIHENMSYSWEVKINLIRELRAIEYAK